MELVDILEDGPDLRDYVENVVTPCNCFYVPFRQLPFCDAAFDANQFVSIPEIFQSLIRYVQGGLKHPLFLIIGDFFSQ